MTSFNASNDKGTCLWCGKVFGFTRKAESVTVEVLDAPILCGKLLGKGKGYCKGGGFERLNKDGKLHGWRCVTCNAQHALGRKSGWKKLPPVREGYHGSEFFCTLRCGFAFAEVLAKGGRRLSPTR